jgi:sodium transport system permease protein
MIATLRTVLVKELRESFRDRRTIVNSLLVGPILAPVFFMLVLKLALARAVSGQDQAAPVTVVNSVAAPNLVQQLRESGLELTLREGTEAEIRSWITKENQLVVLLVPDRFGERFAAGEPAPLQVFADGADSTAGKRSARLAAAVAGYSARVASLRLQARGISPIVMQPVVIDDVDVSTPSARATLFLGILSYVILLATLMGGLYLAIDATAGERERGSLESLLTVPARRDHLIYGKIAAAAAMMLLALAIVVASIAVALRAVPLETFGMSANFGPDVAWQVLLTVAPFTLVAAALLTVVASFTRTYKEAQSWLGLVLLVPTVPIALASVLEIAPRAPLMLVPSMSQHLLIQGLIRGALAWLAGRLYRREAILG